MLALTGIWNVVDLEPSWDSAYVRTLTVKIAVVAASGASAFAHTQARSRRGLAVFGAATGVTALGALFFGIQLG